MASLRRLELSVGLLIVGGIAAVVSMILVFDRISFDNHYDVSAYLGNAGGLHADSAVTLDGISIGKVKVITRVSDPRGSVRAVMAINEHHRIPVDAMLQTSSSGIFGDSFLAFTTTGSHGTGYLAGDGTAAVVAQPGVMDELTQHALGIAGSIDKLLDERMRDDAKRMVRNAADLGGEGAELARALQGQTHQLTELLTSVRALAEELRHTNAQLSGKAETALSTITRVADNLDGTSKRIADAATATLAHVDAVAEETRATLASTRTDLVGLITGLRRLVDGLLAGRGVFGQLLVNQDMAKDVNNIALNLGLASAMVVEHPEVLVFGTSTKESARQRQVRDSLLQRRAFQEGYFAPPAAMTPPDTAPKPGTK